MKGIIVAVILALAAGQAQAEMSYSDEHMLKQIQRDIERLSSSGIGDARDRQMQIEALMRQQEMIYAKYGAQISPRTVIQYPDNRGRW